MTEDQFHTFSKEEVAAARIELLEWYTNAKRTMPWRDLPATMDLQERAYRVLVSEIMLQQTQVTTVVRYYNNWVSTWPTLSSLSRATLEEVQKAWKGLGYYSRGRRLLQLAQKVSEIPHSLFELSKLPGIGAYTGGAVASIVFGEAVPAVDGNVTRVLCRLRAVGGDITSAGVKKNIGNLAALLVPPERPGDWNQAIMELGATICTPRKPNCVKCPLNSLCRAYKNELHDLEDCWLCLPRDGSTDSSSSPVDFPMKVRKTAVRKETNIVCVLTRNEQYFVVKRNSSGLLADLWQFPSFIMKKPSTDPSIIWRDASKILREHCRLVKTVSHWKGGDVEHKFSHISMTYRVVGVAVPPHEEPCAPPECCDAAWVTQEEFHALPVSTAMRKVFALIKDQKGNANSKNRKRKRS